MESVLGSGLGQKFIAAFKIETRRPCSTSWSLFLLQLATAPSHLSPIYTAGDSEAAKSFLILAPLAFEVHPSLLTLPLLTSGWKIGTNNRCLLQKHIWVTEKLEKINEKLTVEVNTRRQKPTAACFIHST